MVDLLGMTSPWTLESLGVFGSVGPSGARLIEQRDVIPIENAAHAARCLAAMELGEPDQRPALARALARRELLLVRSSYPAALDGARAWSIPSLGDLAGASRG